MSSEEPKWLLPAIVEIFHHEQIREHGGIHGIRDEGLLESAINRHRQLFTYGDPPPDICALAAAYAYGLIKNHPYLDGNKRTAAIACELFLLRNGLQFTVTEIEKYPFYLALAAGDVNESQFTEWLRTVTTPSS